jgi:hypothetical protein
MKHKLKKDIHFTVISNYQLTQNNILCILLTILNIIMGHNNSLPLYVMETLWHFYKHLASELNLLIRGV